MKGKIMRGSLDTIILKLLSERDEMYGYEIVQQAKEISAGTFDITEGALYPALHKLEGKGLLETETRKYGNRLRKYYRLTQKGKKEVPQIVKDMESFLTAMQLILNPKTT